MTAFVRHELLKGDVFKTPFSTDRCHQIAQDGLILLSEIGSTMHGVSSDDTGDDIDLMGICIEPPHTVCGLESFAQYEYRSKPVNVRSEAGDTDLTVYSLRKWAKLAAAGNPTVLMLLFADRKAHVKFSTGSGGSLRDNRSLFLSRLCGHKFLGYLDGQMQRFLDPNRTDSKHATRPELIEKYGWDTKTGYHALRLAIQGTELMTTGNVTLPMLADARDFLLKVRQGGYAKDDVTAMLNDVFIPQLKTAIERSSLPDAPDYDNINAYLADLHVAFWQWNGLLS